MRQRNIGDRQQIYIGNLCLEGTIDKIIAVDEKGAKGVIESYSVEGYGITQDFWHPDGTMLAEHVERRKSLSLPHWLEKLTGFSSVGFNVGYWSAPMVPYLAQGAVIPPNKEFMAVLGDQKNGNNIEAPESLIRRIVREESGNNGTQRIEVPVYLNRREIARAVLEEGRCLRTVTGRNPFELI